MIEQLMSFIFPKKSEDGSYFEVLKNRRFLGLWLSQVASQFSTHIVNFALITRIFKVTGSNVAVSGVVLSFVLPAIICAIFAGIFVDRWDRKKILLYTNIAQAFVVTGYYFLGIKIPYIFVIVLIYAFLNQFFIPAEAATIPSIVERKNLLRANSLFMFTQYSAFIFAYALAGPLMYFFGENFPFFAAFVLLLLAAVAVTILPPDRERALNYRKGNGHLDIKNELFSGWRLIRSSKNISFPIMQLGFVQVVMAMIIVLGPGFAQAILKIDLNAISTVIVAPAGIGMLIGSIFIGKVGGKFSRRKIISTGTVMAGFLIVAFSVAHNAGRFLKHQLFGGHMPLFLDTVNLVFTVTIIAGLIGFSGAFITIPSQTLLQESTPKDIRGRVFGVMGVLINIASTLPMILAGVLADVFSTSFVLVAMGILIFLYGVSSFYSLRKQEA